MDHRQRGFTLIEMLVVVALIGILAAVAVGQYRQSILKAREAVLKENLFTMRVAINNYFADKGKYPYDLRTLVDEHYLRDMPVDPITQSSDTWQFEYSQPEEEDISTDQGIEDVRSGADGVGLNGVPYADW